jgi:hypothetical protein
MARPLRDAFVRAVARRGKRSRVAPELRRIAFRKDPSVPTTAEWETDITEPSSRP